MTLAPQIWAMLSIAVTLLGFYICFGAFGMILNAHKHTNSWLSRIGLILGMCVVILCASFLTELGTWLWPK